MKITPVELLVGFIQRYAPVSEEQARVLADYALATWQPLPDEVKYLRIVGERSTGKTIVGKVMAAICKNPLRITPLDSPPGFFLRLVNEKYPSTWIVDLDGGWSFYWTLIHAINAGAVREHAFIRDADDKAIKHEVFGYKILLDSRDVIGKMVRNDVNPDYLITVALEYKKDFVAQILCDEKEFKDDAAQIGVILDAIYALDDDGNEVKNFDLSILDDFDTDLYGMDRRKMTPRQRLQVELAYILCGSVAEAKSTVRNEKTDVLEHALALATHEGQKSMIKMLQAELNRRAKKGE